MLQLVRHIPAEYSSAAFFDAPLFWDSRSYSSLRRNQNPVSLRPRGDRSSPPDLLRAHLVVPALGAVLAVQERQSGIDQLRCEAHFVVREVRQNRQAILRHVLALPAGVLESTAEQLVELHDVLRPVHV